MAEFEYRNSPTSEQDTRLYSNVHQAFDQVKLSDNAKENMLASLMQAAEGNAGSETQPPMSDAKNAGSGKHAFEVVKPSNVAPGSYKHAAPSKRKPKIIYRAVAAAACLAVVALVGAVAFNSPLGSNDATTAMETESIATKGNSESLSSENSVEFDSAVATEEAASDDTEFADESAVIAGSVVWNHPIVVLASGELLTVSLDEDGMPVTVQDTEAYEMLETAQAESTEGGEPVTCSVYVNADGAYAVRYEDDTLFAAELMQ